ncbi:zinc finger protein 423-like [Colias croceus]|uniref:zinc finger protein 423-like n=1 Tax=Colias crocea TaxID=72248 RepID=UPI001E27C8E1|nr:zinc finger protein 423-like [Colias croceus]
MIMLFKGNSSRLEHLIEKIQANKENHDVSSEDIKEALGSVGSTAGSSWPSSTPEPSPSPASTPTSADAVDPEVEGEPPFTLGATEHTPYQCQFCDKAFPRLSYLKKHEQTHSDQMPFRCEFCSRLFKHKRSRDRHVKLHTGDRKYRCAHCESAFSRSDHLKIHMKTHDNQKPFQCTVCNRGYNTAAALTSHMQGHKRDRDGREVDRRRALRCVRCGESFRRPDMLQAHMTTAHGAMTPPRRVASQPPPTLLACIYCTRDTFTSMEQLQLHVRASHSALLNGEGPTVTVEQPTPTDLSRRGSEGTPPVKRPRSSSGSATPQTVLSPSTLLCNQCDAALPDFEAFRAHLKGHLEEGGNLAQTSPTPCLHCGATFTDPVASERHLAAHYLAVSCEYTCHSCARSFSSPDDLQKHLFDQHANSLYRCTLCKEIFESKVAIQVHFAVAHSGENKIWVCRSCGSNGGALRSEAECTAHVRNRHAAARCACGAVVAGARALREHAAAHHSYRCPVPACTDTFAVQYLLERHMQVHHTIPQDVNGDIPRAKQSENNNAIENDCSPCLTGENQTEERRRKNGAVALQCAYCGERTRSRAELEAHTRAHSGNTAARHKCLICDEVLPSAAVLAEHKLTHCKVVAGDTCARCRSRLTSEEAYLTHMARHHPALPAPCIICRQTLASEAEARLHARFHLRPNEDEQRCAICLKTLSESETGEGVRACSSCYARHAAPRPPPPPTADNDCRLCRRSLESPTRLQTHLIEHTFAGIGSFSCYLCSAVFTSAAGLQRHLPEHPAASRPYDCARCGLKFFFRAELDNHALIHLEEAELAQRAFYEAYARGAASAWAALQSDPSPNTTTAPPPEVQVKQENEIKEERNDEYIEVSSPPPVRPRSSTPVPPVVKQEKPDED